MYNYRGFHGINEYTMSEVTEEEYLRYLEMIDGETENKPDKYLDGYENGAWHTLLYFKATGEFPSYAWRHEHLYDDLQSEQDITNTLR
jgi:hypothetical protein